MALFSILSWLSPTAVKGSPSQDWIAQKRLAPCPSSPNCVSSMENQKDDEHGVEPWPLKQPLSHTLPALLDALAKEPRTEVQTQSPPYLHAVASSRIFGFKDDVEFLIGDDAVHVRSASRLGYGDLGVNRKRVARLKQAYLRFQGEM